MGKMGRGENVEDIVPSQIPFLSSQYGGSRAKCPQEVVRFILEILRV